MGEIGFLNGVEWLQSNLADDGSGLQYVTHSGVLDLFDHKLRCYRLSDGNTVFDADDFEAFLSSGLGADPPL